MSQLQEQTNNKRVIESGEATIPSLPKVPPLKLGEKVFGIVQQDRSSRNAATKGENNPHLDSVFKEESSAPDTSRFGENQRPLQATQNNDAANFAFRSICSNNQASPLASFRRDNQSAEQDSVFFTKPSILIQNSGNGINTEKGPFESGTGYGVGTVVMHHNQAFDSTCPALQQSGYNATWVSHSGPNSARGGGTSQEFGMTQEQAALAGNTTNNPFSQNLQSNNDNILMQLLQNQYQKALDSYRQKNQGQEPSVMTRQVMAALTDPTVKNKMQMISKICDGGPRKKRISVSKGDPDIDPLAQYLQHIKNPTTKPKSQAVTARSNKIRDIKNRKNSRANNHDQQQQYMNSQEPWYMINHRQSEATSKQGSNLVGTQRSTEFGVTMHQAQIYPKGSGCQVRKPRTSNFSLRLRTNQRDNGTAMIDKGVGGDEEDLIATDRIHHTNTTPHVSTVQSDEQLSLDQLNSSQNSKANMHQHKKLIVKMLKKRSVFRTAPVQNQHQNNYPRHQQLVQQQSINQQQHVIENESQLDKTETIYLNRLNTFGEATTLFNGSEANRGVSSIGPESPLTKNLHYQWQENRPNKNISTTNASPNRHHRNYEANSPGTNNENSFSPIQRKKANQSVETSFKIHTQLSTNITSAAAENQDIANVKTPQSNSGVLQPELGSDKEANVNMITLDSQESVQELPIKQTLGNQNSKYNHLTNNDSKKQKTYPKSRPGKQASIRRSYDSSNGKSGHFSTVLDKCQDLNGSKGIPGFIKKSTVFSFSSVPNKIKEERKGSVKIIRKSPPSRSILAGRGLQHPMRSGANQCNYLMQVKTPEQYQLLQQPAALQQRIDSETLPVITSEKLQQASVPVRPQRIANIERPTNLVMKSIQQLREADDFVDAGTSPMDKSILDYIDNPSSQLSPKQQQLYLLQMMKQHAGGIQIQNRIINFSQMHHHMVAGVGQSEPPLSMPMSPLSTHLEPLPEQDQEALETVESIGTLSKYQKPMYNQAYIEPGKHISQAAYYAQPFHLLQKDQPSRHHSMVGGESHNIVKLGVKASVDGLNRISETDGIFSSDGGQSPNGRDLQPHYTSEVSRPQTQDQKKRARVGVQDKNNRLIVMENCQLESGDVNATSDSAGHIISEKQSSGVQQLKLAGERSVPCSKQLDNSNNQSNSMQDTVDRLSQTFRLQSIKDDRSMLQEEMLSRKTLQSNIDNELKVILQPEFIKSIGFTANGEVVSPASSKHKPSRQSRLERRIECQTQRVVKPIETVPALQKPLPIQSYKPLSTKIANDALQNDDFQRNTVERFKERSEMKKKKFPASFIKQKISYQLSREYQKGVTDSATNSLTNSLANSPRQQILSHELTTNSVHSSSNQAQQDKPAEIKKKKSSIKVTITNESTIDFDLNDLKKLEQYKGEGSIDMSDRQGGAFEFSQPLHMTAFQIGVIENSHQTNKGNHPNGEMFIPQLKAGISNRQNQTQGGSNMSKNKNNTSPLSGQLCHQIQFDPKSLPAELNALRTSGALVSKTPQGPQLRNVGQFFKSKEELENNLESLEAFKMRKPQPTSSKRSPRQSVRYQSHQFQQDPYQILSLGKTLNLKKQNQRKQLLSMENRRLCTQEDRLFKERLKMANAMAPVPLLPKVGGATTLNTTGALNSPQQSPRTQDRPSIFSRSQVHRNKLQRDVNSPDLINID